MLVISRLKGLFTNYQGAVLSFLLLSFCFDFLDKLKMFYDLDIFKINRFLKAFFLAYACIFIAVYIKYVFDNLKFLLGFVLLLSLVFLSKNNTSPLYVNEYLRYIFPLLVFPLLYFSNFKIEQDFLPKLYKFFKAFILLNSILVFIGFLFEIKAFQTYQFSRFGYNGIILSQGFTPYLYVCATTLFWFYKDKKMILLTLVIGMLSGVKGVFFAEFFLLSLLILFDSHFSKNVKYRALFIAGIIFGAVLAVLFLSPRFKGIIESDGLLAAIFSFRIYNMLELFHQITPENYNLLVGVTGLQHVRLELQIFDILLFFGIIGLLAYSMFFYSLYRRLVNNRTSKVFFITVLVLSVLSGNLLYIPMSLVLVFLVLLALHNSKDFKPPAF